MLTVLLSTSAAQAYGMPCCQLKASATKSAPPAHQAGAQHHSMSGMHCHGDMQQAQPVAEAAPLLHCESTTCSVRTEIAATPVEEAALQPLLNLAGTAQPFLVAPQATTHPARRVPSHSPDPHRQTPVPIRV